MKITGICLLVCLSWQPADEAKPVKDFCVQSKAVLKHRLKLEPAEAEGLRDGNAKDLAALKLRLQQECGVEIWGN